MRKHKQSRIILSLLLGFILLALFLPQKVMADTTDLLDGNGTDVSISVTVPLIIKTGDGSVHYKDSNVSISFSTNDNQENFLKILVDGKEVSVENYTITDMPLAITLKPDYLDNLALGDHTIEIVTVNGNAVAKFSVSSAVIPSTGEALSSTFLIGLIILGVGTSVIIVDVSRVIKRKES